jgi:hypothetical protein
LAGGTEKVAEFALETVGKVGGLAALAVGVSVLALEALVVLECVAIAADCAVFVPVAGDVGDALGFLEEAACVA